MKILKIVLIVLVVIVATEATIYFYLRLRTGRSNSPAEDISNHGPPDELVFNFDATKTAPVFKVNSVDVNNKELGLEAGWPPALEGESFVTKITCGRGNIEVNKEPFSLDGLFSIMTKTSFENMVFSGLCVDRSCHEIDRQCKLFTSGQSRGQ